MGMSPMRCMGNGSRSTSLTVACLVIAWAVLMPLLVVPSASSGEPPDPGVAFAEQLKFATFLGSSAEESGEAIVTEYLARGADFAQRSDGESLFLSGLFVRRGLLWVGRKGFVKKRGLVSS